MTSHHCRLFGTMSTPEQAPALPSSALQLLLGVRNVRNAELLVRCSVKGQSAIMMPKEYVLSTHGWEQPHM